MRQEAAEQEAGGLQQRFYELLLRCGQPVTLEPSPARSRAEGSENRTVFALIEPPNANDVGHLKIEGDRNALSPKPLIFTFGGATGVQENDRVVFDGERYVLLNALPQYFRTLPMGIRCVGIRRESPAADVVPDEEADSSLEEAL